MQPILAMKPIPRSSTEPEVFDREAVLQMLDYDFSLLREIVLMFLDEAPQALADIRAAVEHAAAEQLQRSAHRLKGTAGTFSAPATWSAAHCLEAMGHSGDLVQADQAVDRLEAALSKLRQALLEWMSEFHS